jgi:hypothetical protein
MASRGTVKNRIGSWLDTKPVLAIGTLGAIVVALAVKTALVATPNELVQLAVFLAAIGLVGLVLRVFLWRGLVPDRQRMALIEQWEGSGDVGAIKALGNELSNRDRYVSRRAAYGRCRRRLLSCPAVAGQQ